MYTAAVTAKNHHDASENKIHSDDVAKRFGFTGALVPGCDVFGYMMRVPVAAHGAGWLDNREIDAKLLKPAYDGDALDLSMQADADTETIECRNADDVLLAVATCRAAAPDTPPDPRFGREPAADNGERVEITWDRFAVDESYAAAAWRVESPDNVARAEYLFDDLPVWGEPDATAHPGFWLHDANSAFTRKWQMPAWIHASSRMRTRRAPRVGETAEVRTVVVDRFEKRGHQFGELYVAFDVDGEAALEIWHRAIFRIAGA